MALLDAPRVGVLGTSARITTGLVGATEARSRRDRDREVQTACGDCDGEQFGVRGLSHGGSVCGPVSVVGGVGRAAASPMATDSDRVRLGVAIGLDDSEGTACRCPSLL